MLDRDTLLVVGAIIPSLLGLVAMGVGGSLRERDRGLWLWGSAMLLAGFNQVLLLAMSTSFASMVMANASFLAWIVTAIVAVGRASGQRPRVRWLVAWAIATWAVFAACVWAGDLRLGRLLNWPNIVLMLALALRWTLTDKRRRMPMARGLLVGGLGLLAGSITFRTALVAIGDARALLLMENQTLANMVFLGAALLGIVLATLGMLLTAMDSVNRKLRFLLEVDGLTRLASRHRFMEATRSLPAGVQRAVLMIDADHFKQINDRHGHAGGDAVLQRLGRVFTHVLPAGSLAARMGGEEFAVLLPPGETAAAARHAEAVRAAVEASAEAGRDASRGAKDAAPIPVTVSVGMAAGDAGIEDLLRRADAALYKAKSEGRNRCASA